MNDPCTDPRMNELLGSYLLGACSDAEADAVREHLDACAACAREAGELVVARDALLTVAPAGPAPPALKDRVMAQVRADAALFAAAKSGEADLPTAPARGPSGRRVPWLRSPAGLGVVAACAIALLVGGAVIGSSLGGEDGGSTVRTELGSVDGTRAPGGSAKVVFDESGTARLVVDGLPGPGEGRVYQVWLRTGNEDPVPTRALFSVMSDGSGETAVPGDLGSVDQVLVTSEPEGGSKAPTRPPLVSVDV